jgi:hypothetical protein
MDHVKFIIAVFLVLAFLFAVLAIISIALLQKYNKKVSERRDDRRSLQMDRRTVDRRTESRNGSDRRNSDRRLVERRMKEGSIFDRQNLFGNLSPSFNRQNA